MRWASWRSACCTLYNEKEKLTNEYRTISDRRPRVREAVQNGEPVVALESSIISHGMPYPTNVETALMAEETVREYGAVPATIGVYKGKIVVGLDREQVGALANNPADPASRAMKASVKASPTPS